MKRPVEVAICIILYILLGTFIIIASDDRSILMLLYTTCLFLSVGAIFFGNLYFLFPIFQKGQVKRFFLLNLALLTITYLVSALLFAAWMADVFHSKLLFSHLIHPTIVQDSLPFLVFAWFISFAYAGIKHLVRTRRYGLLRRMVVYSMAFLFIIGTGIFIKMQLDLNYQGDEQTLFIEEPYRNLNEVVQLPQFRNKVVYVDLWYSSCSPCIQEFQHLPTLKAQLKGKPVAYLYLARETSHQNSEQRWKNAIKKYNLQGWHLYMSNQLEEQVWNTILEKQPGKPMAVYPRYLLLDKDGQFVSFDAKRPSTGKDIVAQIEALL